MYYHLPNLPQFLFPRNRKQKVTVLGCCVLAVINATFTFYFHRGGENCTRTTEHKGTVTSVDEPPWVQPKLRTCCLLDILWVIKSWDFNSVSDTHLLDVKDKAPA